MAMKCVERRLATILCADVVGCSRPVGQGKSVHRILKRS